MRSARRFAYHEAQALIDGGEGGHKDEVLTLHRLSQVLRKQRMANGALEVGGNEVKFKLDGRKGRPVEVYEKVMGPANWLIEEFMLLANKRVAAWVGRIKPHAPPFVYRIHDLPDPEKVEQLRTLAKSFGHNLHTDGPPEALPQAINALMQAIKGREEENILQAAHDTQHERRPCTARTTSGTTAWPSMHYTHFTSPIRRYPDLMVHRAMAHYLAHGKALDKKKLELSCTHSSAMEKRAGRCRAGQHQATSRRSTCPSPHGPQLRRCDQRAHHMGHVRGAHGEQVRRHDRRCAICRATGTASTRPATR
jgi:ribonuclease R